MTKYLILKNDERNKLTKKIEKMVFNIFGDKNPDSDDSLLIKDDNMRTITKINTALNGFKNKGTAKIYPIYNSFDLHFSNSTIFMAGVILAPQKIKATEELQLKHVLTGWWTGYYAYRSLLADLYLKKWSANYCLSEHQIRHLSLWMFLSIAINRVSTNEPFLQWIKNLENLEYNHIEKYENEEMDSTYIDMPVFQFMRWMLDFQITGELPKYKIQSKLYQRVEKYWDDEDKLAEVITDILDHHIILCLRKRGHKDEHEKYYPNYLFVPMWEYTDIIPLEILALRRLRLDQGKSFPDIDHPLWNDDYTRVFDLAANNFSKVNEEVFELMEEQLTPYLPTDEELLEYLKTAGPYVPETDD